MYFRNAAEGSQLLLQILASYATSLPALQISKDFSVRFSLQNKLYKHFLPHKQQADIELQHHLKTSFVILCVVHLDMQYIFQLEILIIQLVCSNIYYIEIFRLLNNRHIAVQQLIAKSERRFKDNNPENIYRFLLLLKYVVQTRSASQQLKQEKDYKQDNKVIIPKYADLNLQDDSAIKTEAETAITAAIDKEFQDNIEINSTDEDVDADFEKNINNAVETVNKIIHEISSDISLSSMDKDTRKVLLEEFIKNAVNIKILFVEKHRSNNRLIADAEHLEHLKISDDDDDNKDSVKNTGETLFKLNYTFNTTGAKAPDYLTACSDLNVNSDNPIVANLTLKSWQVTGVAWKLTQELSPVRDEILANKVRLEKTAQYCTLILKVKEQKLTRLYYSTLIICLNEVITN
uniref:Uncharacterized protein n=1 Tax=Coccidioides posadasii RMSCC 3488 TaxID=454284 RepID=A0A0J6F3Y5_COCPO|nr:hypothetical protein CPAG_00018 [Coccidioides posadasii RMSCC 3488]